MILRFCEPVERIDDLLSYRALDLTTLRLTAKSLGRDPYTHREKPTHRVHDCLDRDINEYRHYLTLMTPPRSRQRRTGHEATLHHLPQTRARPSHPLCQTLA